jgi:serine protease Do
LDLQLGDLMNRLVALAMLICALPVSARLPEFADLVAQVGPSVVNIQTAGKPPEAAEHFKRFFKKYVTPESKEAPKLPDEDQELGIGSGFILSDTGYVLTNAHVVAGASEVIVRLIDEREFKARVVGSDTRSDVALVKIEAKGLPFVKIGNSDKTRVGDWVLAIGSPFGFDNTVTAGIVSAKARDTGELVPLIQTDVAINPGNSGGPLINVQGEVIGMNSQIYSRSGGYQGISFSIPINDAIRVADQLRLTGRVVRGRIGIVIDTVSHPMSSERQRGALINSIDPDGPAIRSGLKKDDLIMQYNGTEIMKSGDLPRLVSATMPGTKSTLGVLRNGKPLRVQIIIGVDQ